METNPTPTPHRRIVIVGGGFGGAYCAKELERHAGSDVEITLIDRNNYFLFYPLLIEAGTGSLEPRHAVVPIRAYLKRTHFRMGELAGVDTARKEISFRIEENAPLETIPYDHLVMALGSVTRLPPVPGLAEHGFQMKSLADAVALRDRMIHLLEIADNTADVAARRALLTFIVVGANFTGVEVAGEYRALIREALPRYPRLKAEDIAFHLIEFADRILPQLDVDLADYARRYLEKKGVRIALRTSVTGIEPDTAVLSDGQRLPSKTVIWCAGIAPNPFIAKTALPVNERGYLIVERDLRIRGYSDLWAIGDSATIPGPDGKPLPATAQMAVQEADDLADNLLRSLRGEALKPCEVKNRGALCALGGHSGVAKVFGIKISGFPAWFLFRTYYLLRIPGLARKARIGLDWALAFFWSRDFAQLNVHRSGE